MAEPLQLDKAAALVGKSEVTLRRLIKAGKIPYQKEKTLTGFVYLVDPEKVQSYYKVREGGNFTEDSEEEEKPVQEKTASQPIRVVVASEEPTSNMEQYHYWQKKSEVYEEKYTQEMTKHAQAREELGVWRGRAEQAQAMLIKLLPAPEQEDELETHGLQKPRERSGSGVSNWLLTIITALLIVLVAAAGFYLYLRFFQK